MLHFNDKKTRFTTFTVFIMEYTFLLLFEQDFLKGTLNMFPH